MKVLLINSASNYFKEKPTMPLGVLSIATYLANNGHNVRIYDRTVERGTIKKHLNAFSPDIVCISALAFRSFDDAVKLSKAAKKMNIPVVWGGPIPSLIPELVLKSGVVDYVVIGEGEITLLDLINAIVEKRPLQEVDGLAFIKNNKIVVNKDRTFADLSQLPILDFRLVDPSNYFISNASCKRVVHLYTAKGCVGQCTFCYSPCFHKRFWRARPIEYVLSEIKYLVDNYNIDGVCFADDLLTSNKQYLYNFCNKINESNIDFFWGCDMRIDMCNKKDLQLMYDAGCRWIFFGIESGSQQRQKLIKKYLNLDKALETIDYCKEIGIETTTSFIIGLPGETEEELKETMRFSRKINSDFKFAFIYGPVPQTESYNKLIEQKKLQAPQSYQEWKKLKWFDSSGENFSQVPVKELKVIINYFYYSIFTNKNTREGSEKRIQGKGLFGRAIDILKQGRLKSLYVLFLSGIQFLEIIFYANMYPKILKKYGFKKLE